MNAQRKLKVATASLAGCFGCHMSLLDIDARIFELLELIEFDRCAAHGMSLVRADGAMDLYEGGLRARHADGNTLFDHFDYRRYREVIVEDVKPWSYMKFPFFRALGTSENGWYRVGPSRA